MIEKNQFNPENLEKQELTSEEKLKLLKNDIYKDISSEYNISHDTALKLKDLKSENLDKFKENLQNHEQINTNDKNNILSFTNEKLRNLYNTISWAEKLLNKDNIENVEVYTIWEKDSITKRFLPNLYEKVIDPANYKEQVIWLWLWSIDSFSSGLKLLYDIWAWIVKTPKHTYIILSWKWTYKNISKRNFLICLILSLIVVFYFIFKLFI